MPDLAAGWTLVVVVFRDEPLLDEVDFREGEDFAVDRLLVVEREGEDPRVAIDPNLAEQSQETDIPLRTNASSRPQDLTHLTLVVNHTLTNLLAIISQNQALATLI